VTPGLFFTCHTPKIKGGLQSQGRPVSFLDPAAFPPFRLTRSTSTYPGDAAESSRKETLGCGQGRSRALSGSNASGPLPLPSPLAADRPSWQTLCGGVRGVREHGTSSLQGLQEIRHRCLQPPPAEFLSKVVHPDERLHHDRTNHVLSLSAPGRGSRGDQRHASQDHPLCIGAEQVCCVGRAVPRGGGMPCAGTSF